MKAPSKHATVTRDGYEVPLIGIAPEAILDICDCCGDIQPMRTMRWTGKQLLCKKCDLTPTPDDSVK